MREEKNKLREKENKLREKENKLREEKNKLREEKNKLREKEIKLREKESKLREGNEKVSVADVLWGNVFEEPERVPSVKELAAYLSSDLPGEGFPVPAGVMEVPEGFEGSFYARELNAFDCTSVLQMLHLRYTEANGTENQM